MKICDHCGHENKRKRRDALYCSRRCTRAAYYFANRERARAIQREYRQSRDRSAEIARQEERRKERRKADPLLYRARQYGLTREHLENLLIEQDHRCAICGELEPWERLFVDHDHATGQIRGLLCPECNMAIGLLRDDLDVIASAALYVRRWREAILDG